MYCEIVLNKHDDYRDNKYIRLPESITLNVAVEIGWAILEEFPGLYHNVYQYDEEHNVIDSWKFPE